MDEQVARLEELLEVHEEIAGDDAAELADCASFDGSAEGERLRRSLTCPAPRAAADAGALDEDAEERESTVRRPATMVTMKDDEMRGDGDAGSEGRHVERGSAASLGRRRRQGPGSPSGTSLVRWRRWRW